MAARDRMEDRFEDIEKAYKRVIEEIQQQMEELDDRFEKLLDNLQRQLPENAADFLKRGRKANREARKRLSEWSDQVQEAAQEFMGRADSGAKKPAAKKAPAKKAAAKKAPARGGFTAKSTKAELLAEAKRLGIKGRSSMNKSQLQAAVRKARREPR